ELHPPRGVVDITLADDIDAANGFTTVFPTNRITIYAAPPAGDHGLLFFDSWLRLVTTHELTHVFHLDRSRGLWSGLQQVFGRAPGLFPNEYQPSWVIEGIATYYESRFTNAGRGRGSFPTQLPGAGRAAAGWRPPARWCATGGGGPTRCRACPRTDDGWRTCPATARARACYACSTRRPSTRSRLTGGMPVWTTTGWGTPS